MVMLRITSSHSLHTCNFLFLPNPIRKSYVCQFFKENVSKYSFSLAISFRLQFFQQLIIYEYFHHFYGFFIYTAELSTGKKSQTSQGILCIDLELLFHEKFNMSNCWELRKTREEAEMPGRPTNRFGGNRLPDGWEKGETLNKIPFYINHKLEITQWDHPVLEQGNLKF